MYILWHTLFIHFTTDWLFSYLGYWKWCYNEKGVQISLWYIDLLSFQCGYRVGCWVTRKFQFQFSLFWGGAKPIFPVTPVGSHHWCIYILSSICCLLSKWKTFRRRRLILIVICISHVICDAECFLCKAQVIFWEMSFEISFLILTESLAFLMLRSSYFWTFWILILYQMCHL